jgi:hypothetical protein
MLALIVLIFYPLSKLSPDHVQHASIAFHDHKQKNSARTYGLYVQTLQSVEARTYA